MKFLQASTFLDLIEVHKIAERSKVQRADLRVGNKGLVEQIRRAHVEKFSVDVGTVVGQVDQVRKFSELSEGSVASNRQNSSKFERDEVCSELVERVDQSLTVRKERRESFRIDVMNVGPDVSRSISK